MNSLRLSIGAILVIFLAACTARQSHPPRYALLAGGSGEPDEENFLIEDLRQFHHALSSRGWQIQTVAGSRDRLVKNSRRASGENLRAGVKETLERAAPGEQALILFHSHGLEQEVAWGQKSHSIASEDRDPSGAQPGFDLDSIEPELLRARDRGVRVALIDLSCYSGQSQTLQGPSCTVTLASPSYVSICSSREAERHFTAHFISSLSRTEDVDLESHFLSSRRIDRDSVNLPQISSRAAPSPTLWDELLLKLDPLDLRGDLAAGRAPLRPQSFDSLRASARRELAALKLPSPLSSELSTLTSKMIDRRERIDRALPTLASLWDSRNLRLELPGRPPFQISAGNLSDLLTRSPAQNESLDGLPHSARGLLAALDPLRDSIQSRFRRELDAFSRLDRQVRDEALALEVETGELLNLERQVYELRSARTHEGCANFSL